MMKKLLLPVCLLAVSSVSIAQKDRSKNVETKYLNLPAYDISKTDPASLKLEFAMDETTFGTEKLKDTKATCVPKGGSIKDAVEVTTYYYEVPYKEPNSFIVAYDNTGNVIYSEKVTSESNATAKYGYQKCEYWVSDKLKKDWAGNGSSFKSSELSKFENKSFDQAVELAKSNIYLSYFPEEFALYSGKGKIYDYTELDNAFEKAMLAYNGIAENGLNSGDFARLKECIVVWEKELENLDVEDKKARITKDIGKGLHENCSRAYMIMYDFDNAGKHGKAFLKLFGNFSNNRSNALKNSLIRMELQKISAEKNLAIMKDIDGLNKLAQTSAGVSVKVERLSSSEFERLVADDLKFKMGQHSEVSESRKEEEAEAIASGELNPYQKFVTVSSMGTVLAMTMPPSAFSGIPELKELPAEICAIEGVNQLLLMNNSVETISSDIGKMSELTKLDLTGNNIKTLPAEIGQLKKLKTLRLGKNPIESFPEEIANCESLKSIVLKGSNVSNEVKDQLARLLPDCKVKY